MSTGESEPEVSAAVAEEADRGEGQEFEAKRKLELEVTITDAGPCKKHLKITIPRIRDRPAISRNRSKTVRKDARRPGFSAGHGTAAADRQAVTRSRSRSRSSRSLLMSSLDQIDKEYKLEPIVQPRLDIEAIEIPETGPMSFEMDVEVRPQFDLPNYKGLKVKRPVAELTEKDVDDQLNRFLEGPGIDRSQAGGQCRGRRLHRRRLDLHGS